MDNTQIFQMADDLKAARDLKKDLDKKTKANNAKIEELDRQLSDAMAQAELDKFTRNGTTFYLNNKLFASPKAEMKEEMFEALTAHGYGDLITRTVNPQTLSSFCREQRDMNQDEIPGWLTEVVNAYEKVTVGVRKA